MDKQGTENFLCSENTLHVAIMTIHVFILSSKSIECTTPRVNRVHTLGDYDMSVRVDQLLTSPPLMWCVNIGERV